MKNDPWRHQCNNWFKDDLGEALGVDVFARPFPIEQGWDIYENDNVRLLVIRQENMDRLPQAIGTLYGIDAGTVTMESRNKAEDKDYSTQYEAVKKAWSPSDEEIEEVYSPAFVGHFYTDREIEKFKERWRKQAGASSPETSHEARQKQSARAAEMPIAKASSQPACEHRSPPTSQAFAHDWNCHPCAQCAHELIALKQHARAMERIKALWPVKLLLRCRKLFRRMTANVRMTK